jgi:hypothetical protein
MGERLFFLLSTREIWYIFKQTNKKSAVKVKLFKQTIVSEGVNEPINNN